MELKLNLKERRGLKGMKFGSHLYKHHARFSAPVTRFRCFINFPRLRIKIEFSTVETLICLAAQFRSSIIDNAAVESAI